MVAQSPYDIVISGSVFSQKVRLLCALTYRIIIDISSTVGRSIASISDFGVFFY